MWGWVRLGHASEILPDYQWRAYARDFGEILLNMLVFSNISIHYLMCFKTLSLFFTPMCWLLYRLLIYCGFLIYTEEKTLTGGKNG